MVDFFQANATQRLIAADAVLPVVERPPSAAPVARRPRANAFGGYGSYGGYRSAGSDGSKWHGGLSNSGVAPILNHTLLRINARRAYHESLQARAVVERHTDTVVDNGLKLSATPDADILGITAEAAEDWARAVDPAFDHWARNRKSMLAETMNFYQSQRMAGTGQQRDGEYFVRFHYSARKDLLNPLQLSFIDPGQIQGFGHTSTYGLNLPFKDGIERDANGKETAYHVMVLQSDLSFKASVIPAEGARSKRRMMIHGFQPEYPGQGRGFSRLSHALQEFENITDFSSSEIKKAIAQSQLTMWVKPSKENAATNIFEEVAKSAPVGPARLTPAGEALAAENNLDPGDLVRYIELQEAAFGVPGSTGVFNLREGEELKSFDNTAPVTSYGDFLFTIATHLSASLSMPVEVVLMKFGENYSASRAALLLFWRVAQVWRDELASDFLNIVYENWLAGEIAAGRIFAPGWSDPRMREAWLKNSWIGSPMPNIDPMRTAKADKEYVEMGAQDLDRVAQNLNGTSGKANRAKLARQFAELPSPPWSKNNPSNDGNTGGDSDNKDGNQ